MTRDMENRMPASIRDITDGMRITGNNVGMSGAGVYECRDGDECLFLKVEPIGGELRREYELMEWLDGRLPVPAVIHWEEASGYCWLLMSVVEGHMVCADEELENPTVETIQLLAEGIRMLWSVDIADCPFDNGLDVKLADALRNIETGRVDMEDFNSGNACTPMELWQRLDRERPPEDLVFTHGDYCLPNIFIGSETIAGFIDLGRAGIADRWQDIALCVRSLRYNFRDEGLVEHFFRYLGVEPDWRKIEYYILLDELF